ncbi:MAG: PP0621 family protein [Gammaproteobacteria bacterium]
MNLLRLLLIAIVIWFAMRMVKRVISAKTARKGDPGYRGNMVTCEICGVYLPENDAVSNQDGKFQCDLH